MFGGLHIELAALKAAGLWLQGSGWSDALVHSAITTRGTADSFLKGSHIKRASYAHQVFAAALYILQRKAYDSTAENNSTVYNDWCNSQCKVSPQFHYWALTLELELTILAFVRSLCQSNFHLYVQTIEALLPWFFALDRSNYARWLSVHVSDIKTLQVQNSTVAENFNSGKFTVQKTTHKFSAIALDHAHEQNNKWLKGDGGIIGLTENAPSLNRWMLAGPELVRVVKEFETSRGMTKPETDAHHEQSQAFDSKFTQDVKALVCTLDELGNPFDEDGSNLISLESKDIADTAVNKTRQFVKSNRSVSNCIGHLWKRD